MTSAEIEKLGRDCLREYEGRLKVKGIKPYDAAHVEEVKCKVPGDFNRVSADILKAGIERVLDSLAEKGSFTMSEPRAWVPPPNLKADQTVNVIYNDLRITFFEIISQDAFIWMFCWYYSS